MKVLLPEDIHRDAAAAFLDAGFDVSQIKHSPTSEEFLQKASDVHILCVRSRSRADGQAIRVCRNLMAVGTFCTGTEHIDLDACGKRGHHPVPAGVLNVWDFRLFQRAGAACGHPFNA